MKIDHARRRPPFLLPVFLIAAVLMSSCIAPTKFSYQPNPTTRQTQQIPISVVVLPFEDGTPEWKTDREFFFYCYNYAKGPAYDSKQVAAFLPPERWARDFARELAGSKVFSEVRFAEGSEDAGGGLLLRGKVLKALFRQGSVAPFTSNHYDYSVQFQAIRRSDGSLLWERIVSRQYKSAIYGADATPVLLQSMFGEALDDLVKALEAKRDEWPVFQGEPPAPASGAGESVEEILRKINKQ